MLSTVAASASLAMLLIAEAASPAASPQPAVFRVGVSARPIAPKSFERGDLYLGGGPARPKRQAQGNLAPTYARAIAISGDDEGSGIILGVLDVNAMFAAYASEADGLAAAAEAASEATGLPVSRFLLATSQTESGLDGIGIWGGTPDSLRSAIATTFARAAVEAWIERKEATLSWAEIEGPTLRRRSEQSSEVDRSLRVLMAKDSSTLAPKAFVVGWQAAPRIVGGTEVHPDWPGLLATSLETRFPGSFAMSVLGAVGGTRADLPEDAIGLEAATGYAKDLAQRISPQHSGFQPVAAGPVTAVALRYADVMTNPFMLDLSLLGGGEIRFDRDREPPWMPDAATLSTRAAVARVGDLLIAGAPGTAYPQIQRWLDEQVGGKRGALLVSMVGDQMGPLVSPAESVAPLIEEGEDSALDFIVSPILGDHSACALLAGAKALNFDVTPLERCEPWRQKLARSIE